MFKSLLEKASRGGYAIPAFNFTELNDIKAILEAAEEQKSPVILLANWEPTLWLGFDYLKAIIDAARRNFSIPFLLQLDHGENIEQVLICIRHGFDVVMIDGSHLSYEENVAVTRKVVEIAHSVQVAVEGEIGQIKGEEAGKKSKRTQFTDPEMAKEFAEVTKVDALAIAFGNQHGYYQNSPRLAFDVLQKVNNLVDTPLVMHGGTGIPEQSVKKAINSGVSKINIGTALKETYLNTLRRETKNIPDLKLVRVFNTSKEEIKKRVKYYLKMFGSVGKILPL